jgi:hypothetical protein
MEFEHSDFEFAFDLAQGGELVETFRISCFVLRILSILADACEKSSLPFFRQGIRKRVTFWIG